MSDDNRRYNEVEMREVLRRVQQRGHVGQDDQAAGLTGGELIETAKEVGFTEAEVGAALVEYEGDRRIAETQQELRQISYRRLSAHSINFLMINGALLGLNLWMGPPLWFLVPLLIWGVLLLYHMRAAFFPDPDRLRERARARQERRRLKESGKEFGHALTKGAAQLLSVTAKRIDKEVERIARPDPGKR